MLTKTGILLDDDLIAAVIAKGGFSSPDQAVLAALRWYVSFLKRKAAEAARRKEARTTRTHNPQSTPDANQEEAFTEQDPVALAETATYLGIHATEDEAVEAALKKYHRHQRQLEVIKLFGTIDYDPDYDYKAARSGRGGHRIATQGNNFQMSAMSTATLNVHDYVHSDPKRMGGVPVFKGSRVPVKSLFDYLRAGDTIDRFLDHFEGITREQVDAVLRLAEQGLVKAIGLQAQSL